LCASGCVIRVIKSRRLSARHVAHMGDMTSPHNVLVEKSERTRPLGRHRDR